MPRQKEKEVTVAFNGERYYNKRVFSPAMTDEDRETQLAALAYDLAEQRLRDGTASSQLIHDCIKLDSRRDRLERDILEEQKKLIVAKTENIESSKKLEEVYLNAVAAMKRYQGVSDNDEFEDIQ